MPKNKKKGNKEIGFLHSSLTTNYHLHTLSCDTHDKCKNKRIATIDLVLNSKYLILYLTLIYRIRLSIFVPSSNYSEYIQSHKILSS